VIDCPLTKLQKELAQANEPMADLHHNRWVFWRGDIFARIRLFEMAVSAEAHRVGAVASPSDVMQVKAAPVRFATDGASWALRTEPFESGGTTAFILRVD
jgi:hypothetical protein